MYINNLTETTLVRLHEGLLDFPAYLGFIPTTYSSRVKTYLSTTLRHRFLKNGKRVIQSHDDDFSNEENVNFIGYPFENYGYEVFSLQSIFFDMFLIYKIERPVMPGFEVDTEMAINAISHRNNIVAVIPPWNSMKLRNIIPCRFPSIEQDYFNLRTIIVVKLGMDIKESTLILNRNAFSVVTLDDKSDELQYWLTQTPQERLRHMQRLRHINYGNRASERLQRFFEVVELKSS